MEPYYNHPKFKLYQADSLNFLGSFPEDSVDMVFADPPYLLSNGGFTVHAVTKGVDHLSGCSCMVSDLRAGAALVLAGLAAKGKTTVLRIYHLDRGYEKLDKKLRALGAKIKRVRKK
jgi:DNA modification methylase